MRSSASRTCSRRPRSPRSKTSMCRSFAAPATTCCILIDDILDLSKVESSQLGAGTDRVLVERSAGKSDGDGGGPGSRKRPGPRVRDRAENAHRPGRRPDTAAASTAQFAWQRDQVHGIRRSGPTSHAGWGLLRPGRIAVHDLGHRHRHSGRQIGHSVSSDSRKPTRPPLAGTGARGWGSRFRSAWSN